MNYQPTPEEMLNNFGGKTESFSPLPENEPPSTQKFYDTRYQNKGKSQQEDKPPLPLVYFDDLKPMLDARDFVQGLLLENSAVVIYGESNAGKTFWTTDLALHVAAGLPWNGRRVEQGGVIYCVLEGGQGFYNRVWAWGRERGVSNIPFASVPSQINLLNPEADTERLIQAIKTAAATKSFPVKLVVIDTLSRALAGGNENAPDDMGALVMNMDRIRQETGATVLFVHHCGKDAAKGARGHSCLRAAIDTEIEVRALGDDGKEAELLKQRDLPKGDVFQFTLNVKEIGLNRYNEKITTCVVSHGDVTREKASKKPALTKAERTAKQFLADLLCEHGKPLPCGLGWPPSGLHGVMEDDWRTECESRKLSMAETADNRARIFRRTYASLLDKGVVGAKDDFVWLTHPKNEGI